jgi:predicted transcriptional regulator
MARAILSSEQMNFYFTTLLNHSLLDVQRDNDNNQIYRTTHKGIRFLQCCVNIKSLISPSVPPKVSGDLLYL